MATWEDWAVLVEVAVVVPVPHTVAKPWSEEVDHTGLPVPQTVALLLSVPVPQTVAVPQTVPVPQTVAKE